ALRDPDPDGRDPHPEGLCRHCPGRPRPDRRRGRRGPAAGHGRGPGSRLCLLRLPRCLWLAGLPGHSALQAGGSLRPDGETRMIGNLFGLLLLLGAGLAYPWLLPGALTVGITILLFAGWATAWDILGEIGRASCRERVEISVVAVS